MARARNLAEFEAALKRLQLPMVTVMYADRAGHILHLFGGRTPVRPAGNWDWDGIVPGDTSATLWTQTHPYDELPRVLDPASGWLQNANDPPWTTTFPPALDPNKFPAYMAPRFMHFRAQHSARLLAEDDEITFDEFVTYKHSSRMEVAERMLDDLLPAARQSEGIAQRAAAVLAAWDRCSDAASRGAVLFFYFFRGLSQRAQRAGSSPFAMPWKEDSPRTTPDGLADPAAAVAALAAAAENVEKTHGALDVPWGEVFRLRRAGVDLPASGGPGGLGTFRVISFRAADSSRFEATGGDSYVAAIEFSNPVRALVLNAPGNATQPDSPHRADQLGLFSKKQLRPAWRSRKEIEAHLGSREMF
jgi:acyl-homoserine-lactone acylase